jgi:hypothetical protein
MSEKEAPVKAEEPKAAQEANEPSNAAVPAKTAETDAAQVGLGSLILRLLSLFEGAISRLGMAERIPVCLIAGPGRRIR